MWGTVSFLLSDLDPLPQKKRIVHLLIKCYSWGRHVMQCRHDPDKRPCFLCSCKRQFFLARVTKLLDPLNMMWRKRAGEWKGLKTRSFHSKGVMCPSACFADDRWEVMCRCAGCDSCFSQVHLNVVRAQGVSAAVICDINLPQRKKEIHPESSGCGCNALIPVSWPTSVLSWAYALFSTNHCALSLISWFDLLMHFSLAYFFDCKHSTDTGCFNPQCWRPLQVVHSDSLIWVGLIQNPHHNSNRTPIFFLSRQCYEIHPCRVQRIGQLFDSNWAGTTAMPPEHSREPCTKPLK